jgi:hypothetical protein
MDARAGMVRRVGCLCSPPGHWLLNCPRREEHLQREIFALDGAAKDQAGQAVSVLTFDQRNGAHYDIEQVNGRVVRQVSGYLA